jgi:uncharacterized protein
MTAPQRDRFPHTVLWRRLDVDGMDACCIDLSDKGYIILGTALFLAESGPAKMDYQVICDADWSSRSARIRGWVGAEIKSFVVLRSTNDIWTVNGKRIDTLDGLLDVDLGFTPATNANAIKRLGIEIGSIVETTAVWLDVGDWSFKPLLQIYQRCSETSFVYNSPSHDYNAELQVDDFGAIRSYPQLWEAISPLHTSERGHA